MTFWTALSACLRKNKGQVALYLVPFIYFYLPPTPLVCSPINRINTQCIYSAVFAFFKQSRFTYT